MREEAGPLQPVQTICSTDQSFVDTYGLAPNDVALIRPDGHVGWRARSGAHVDEVVEIVGSILDRQDLSVGYQWRPMRTR